MMTFDWSAVGLGFVIGAITSAVFFVGLALGMRMALRSSRPVGVLMLSAVLRILTVLGIGWLVLEQAGAWSLLGYGGAFVSVRILATTLASIRTPTGDVP